MDVLDDLERRNGQTEDDGFQRISNELLENPEIYNTELSTPTLKHGTSTFNIDDIAQEGLIPGEENNSCTGETSSTPKVCTTTTFPIALRYGQIANSFPGVKVDQSEWIIDSSEHPMVVELPVSKVEEIEITNQNSETIDEFFDPLGPLVYDVIVDFYEGKDRDLEYFGEFYEIGNDEFANDIIDENENALEVAHSLLKHDSGINPQKLMQRNFFEYFDHNELSASFIKEVRTNSISPGEMKFYVPLDQLSDYRDRVKSKNPEIDIGALESRALLHEERMKSEYKQEGYKTYKKPESGFGMKVFDASDSENYFENPEVIDISSLEGHPIYHPEEPFQSIF